MFVIVFIEKLKFSELGIKNTVRLTLFGFFICFLFFLEIWKYDGEAAEVICYENNEESIYQSIIRHKLKKGTTTIHP